MREQSEETEEESIKEDDKEEKIRLDILKKEPDLTINNFQKELLNEKGECKQEILIAVDNELEKTLRTIIESKIEYAYQLSKEYHILVNRIDSLIFAKMNSGNKLMKNLPLVEEIQHKVPTFVLQNIQIYETLFSYLKIHPCYLMKIIRTHLFNNNQVNNLITFLYNSSTCNQTSICSLISLAQMIFQYEIAEDFKIEEIRNFKVGSIFWQIYSILFLNQKSNREYVIDFIEHIINVLFCKNYFETENLKDLSNIADRIKIMQTALDKKEDIYFSRVTFVKTTNEYLKSLIKSILDCVLENMEQFEKISQPFLTKNSLYLHACVVDIYLKNEEKKFKESNRGKDKNLFKKEEASKNYENEYVNYMIKAKLKAEKFIRNLYFGIIISVILNYKEFNIQIEEEYKHFIEKSNNLKILADLIEKYINDDNFDDDKEYISLNKMIHSQSEEKNKYMYSRLTSSDYYNLTLNHLGETLKDYFSYEQPIYEITLEFLFNLHNLYCKALKSPELENVIF